MSLNGIDIASYQAGIDLAAVPADFVIVKATQGTGYVNPYCDEHYHAAKAAGRLVGVYHYAGGNGAEAEAEFFVNNIRGYLGEALLVLDWEAAENSAFGSVDYAKAFLDHVFALTGVKPLIYMSASVVTGCDWSAVAAGDYGLWVAGYYNGYNAMSYNPDAPMQNIAYWGCASMYQYTSSGQLPNYSGSLDLDVFYGDESAWRAYAGAAQAPSDTEPPTGDVPITDRPICNEQHFGIWVRNVHDNVGVSKVMAAVWSAFGGQDDLVWYDMAPAPDGEADSYALSLDVAKHGGVSDGNNIIADVYAFDAAGNRRCLGRCTTEMTTRIDSPLKPMGNVISKAHVQNFGWLDTVGEGETAGTTGKGLRLEALAVRSCIDGIMVKLQGHVEDYGWMHTVNQDQAVGTITQSKRLEAIKLTLEGEKADQYAITYRAHVQGIGWMDWVSDGTIAGTTGKGLRMEAVQIKIENKAA